MQECATRSAGVCPGTAHLPSHLLRFGDYPGAARQGKCSGGRHLCWRTASVCQGKPRGFRKDSRRAEFDGHL